MHDVILEYNRKTRRFLDSCTHCSSYQEQFLKRISQLFLKEPIIFTNAFYENRELYLQLFMLKLESLSLSPYIYN